MEEWSIRSLLNPVIARLLIYGVNPNDVEYIVGRVERSNLLNVHLLEKVWLTEWENKARQYLALGETAARQGNSISAREFFMFAARCYYAVFLVNLKELADKKRIYRQYVSLYRRSTDYYTSRVECVEIPLGGDMRLPAYLHHGHREYTADKAARQPCVIIFAGLGSSKEEMHTLARPLAERGIAVLVPDMPGSGEALFERGIKCRIVHLNAAFSRVVDYLETRSDINPQAIGAYGLCMGGGYAHRAAASDPRYAFCITLFPLFITQTEKGVTPQWMRQGPWHNFQVGELENDQFLDEMRQLEEGELICPYYFIHGENDNWMKLEVASRLFDKARGEKHKLIITEEPAFSNEQVVTHTMPVGEQLHWISHVVADWVAARCR
jgi:dienelactone hydrolase